MEAKRKRGKVTALCASVAFLFTLGASCAFADSMTLTLGDPNSALSAFPGPYATVTIATPGPNSSTATVTFSSMTSGGYIYLLGANGAVDLNVNGAYTLGPVTESSIDGFTPMYKNNTPGNVSEFGYFNLSLNNKGGFTNSATTISFTLTKNSGTWASAADVVIFDPNNPYGAAAIKGFACSQAGSGCSTSVGAATTGFAGVSVPEPSSLALLASGLLFVGLGIGFRRRLALRA